MSASKTRESDPSQLRETRSDWVAAIDRSQAVIEFTPDGRVLDANQNFLDVMGYASEEIVGKHHRMFCERSFVESVEYQEFWDHLASGNFETGEFKRIGNNGKEIWIRASYNPVFDAKGSVCKVVKFAVDVTKDRLAAAEIASKVDAVNRAQAVIEFDLSGNVLSANDNFLQLTGYSLSEIVGQHHRMFCDPEFTQSAAYTEFWQRLGCGQFEVGEYKRLGKGGREVWIQATYNPIFDTNGKPVKVVKFASDVTAERLANAEIEGRMSAVDRAQAVIEFDLEGYVTAVNENFLRVIGYSRREIIGQHHSTFCSDEYKRSEEYRDFWLKLAKGEVISGRFHRVGNFGRDVYIQATYNPIFDLDGKPFKVVKYAYDVTPSVERERRISSSTSEMGSAIASLEQSIDALFERSNEANGVLRDTRQHVDKGGAAVKASLEAIGGIGGSSQSIGDVLRSMTELASETNLLAFNASIEAARAGEHGIGFSIVADEVRKLAERSFEATQQMARLVQESVSKVEKGGEVCADADSAFSSLNSGVDQVSSSLDAILAFVGEQQRAFAEVNQLVGQLASADID